MITVELSLKERVARAQQTYAMDNKVYKPVWMYAIQQDTTPDAVIADIESGRLPGAKFGSRWFVELVENKEGENVK